jgi:PhzF family phenazine biosynthesis protein
MTTSRPSIQFGSNPTVAQNLGVRTSNLRDQKIRIMEGSHMLDRRKFLNLTAGVSLFRLHAEKAELPASKNTRSFEFREVDVFSPRPLLGNALAVVISADTLSDQQMLSLANWTNLSETTFLLKPGSPAADYRVRIFNSDREVQFAGHPTLGSCHVWLASGGIPKRSVIVQECGIGLVSIRRSSDELAFAAPKLIRHGTVGPEVLARVARGLNVNTNSIVASNWVDNGSGWLAIMLRSRAEVLALRPNYGTLAGLKVGVFAAFDPAKDGTFAQFEVRAFSAEAAVGHEDPVTGSLNAGLARWLIGAGIARSEYVVSQGTVLKREGRVHIQQDGSEIWVGGSVRTCVTGTVTI